MYSITVHLCVLLQERFTTLYRTHWYNVVNQSNTVYIKSRAIHDPESKKDVDSFLSILEMLKKKQNFNQYIYSQ